MELGAESPMGVFLRLGSGAGIRFFGQNTTDHGGTTVEVGPERLLLVTAGQDDRVGIGHRGQPSSAHRKPSLPR